MLASIDIPTNSARGSSSHSFQRLLFEHWPEQLYHVVVLICICLITNEAGYLFLCLLAISQSFLMSDFMYEFIFGRIVLLAIEFLVCRQVFFLQHFEYVISLLRSAVSEVKSTLEQMIIYLYIIELVFSLP